YRLCRDLGASRPAAFWTWLVVAFTPPVLVHSGHVYPEIPAALGLTLAARSALRLGDRVFWPLVGTAAGGAFATAMKDRFAAVALGLLLGGLARVPRRRRVGLLLLAGTLAAGALIWKVNAVVGLFPRFPDLGWFIWRIPPASVYLQMGVGALGIFADQEHGLLYLAPQWSLAGLGAVLLWRRHPGAVAGLLGAVLFYVVVLMRVGWVQWDAGWTPPPRFPLAVVPL